VAGSRFKPLACFQRTRKASMRGDAIAFMGTPDFAVPTLDA
jgi:hypothetical protein